jgi:TldD protein
MLAQLKALLAKIDAPYADLRHERVEECTVAAASRSITGVSSNVTEGYVLRVLKDGGFASIAVSSASELEHAAQLAAAHARLLGRARQTTLAATPVVRESVRRALAEDPRAVDLEEKLALVRHYAGVALAAPRVVATSLSYQDVRRTKTFASTEGSEVEEELVTTSLRGAITAREGGLVQSVRCSIGGGAGFAPLRGRDAVFAERARLAGDLLDAEPVASGAYDVVLDPVLAGVFTHEAFGHSSEADIAEASPTQLAAMRIGAELGTEVLSITDDATRRDVLGHYRYDDEGVPVRRVELMRQGVLTGRLHSRQTSARLGEPLTGHAVAEDYRFAPLVRMGAIFIEPGTASLDELLARLGDGLYLVSAKGGQTAGAEFTFGGQWGFRVRGGRLAGLVRDFNISGNMYRTLRSVEAVGADLFFDEIGACGKGAQANIRSTIGAPPVLVRGLVVGGT